MENDSPESCSDKVLRELFADVYELQTILVDVLWIPPYADAKQLRKLVFPFKVQLAVLSRRQKQLKTSIIERCEQLAELCRDNGFEELEYKADEILNILSRL